MFSTHLKFGLRETLLISKLLRETYSTRSGLCCFRRSSADLLSGLLLTSLSKDCWCRTPGDSHACVLLPMFSELPTNGFVQMFESESLPVDAFSKSAENDGRAGIIGERQQTLNEVHFHQTHRWRGRKISREVGSWYDNKAQDVWFAGKRDK